MVLAAVLTFAATFVPSAFQPVQGQICQSMPAIAPIAALSGVCPGDEILRVAAQQVYYPVEGATAAQLVSQIQQRGPLWRDGNRYEAMHTWKMHRTFGVSEQGDRCVLSQPKIIVETRITLPQWQPPRTASVNLVSSWNKYTTALKTHEDGHQAISLAAGREVERILSSFPSYPTCAELRLAAKAAVSAVLEHTSQAQQDYDRKTQHGLVQGASYVRWLVPSTH